MKIHRVMPSQTVYDVAAEYGTNPIRISLDNELEYPTKLAAGRELLILTPTRTYTVKRDDTLEKIANRFNVHKDVIKMQNPELYAATRLYNGQVLNIKSSAVTLGIGIANGYLYPGYTKERLIRCLPYLSYITVCCAVVSSGKISTIFDDSEVLELSLEYGKLPLLRIYVTDGTEIYSEEIAESIILLAKSRGYFGITLTESALSIGKTTNSLLNFKKKLINCELKLVIERDLNVDGCCDIADMTVLSYDKIQLESIPSFRDGECAAMINYAENCTAESSFIEISPFSLVGGKYKEKTQALALLDRYRGEIVFDEEKKILTAELGRGKKKAEFISESLENTKAKLELAAELGYLGISFDIMRAHLADLLLFASMFDRPPKISKLAPCNPKN